MNTYDKCKILRNIVVSIAAEIMFYKSWPPEFCINRLRELPIDNPNFCSIQPLDLTLKEMTDLSFGKWSEETDIMLIPLWLLPFLADKLYLTDLDGKDIVLNRDEIDNDHRFGYLAYGVHPKILKI